MRPHIKINFACSLDGKIALRGGKAYRFSDFDDLVRVHKMRAESDIIIVGKNTINLDDPKLVVNEKYYQSSKIPDAGILDSNLTVNGGARVFSYRRNVVVFTRSGVGETNFVGNRAARVMIRKSPEPILRSDFVVRELGDMGYRNVMIEGGKSVISSFITEGNWDEISIFYAPILVGEDGIPMFNTIHEPLKMGLSEISKLGSGFLVSIKKGL